MATNAVAPHEQRIEQPSSPKLSEKEAKKRLIELVEKNMERKGLTEDQKNYRVGRFAAFVDRLIGRRSKP